MKVEHCEFDLLLFRVLNIIYPFILGSYCEIEWMVQRGKEVEESWEKERGVCNNGSRW